MLVRAFLASAPNALIGALAAADARRFRGNEREQIRAWEASCATLRTALDGWEVALDWELVLEYEMLRLGRRIDAVLLTPRAILVLEFKQHAAASLKVPEICRRPVL